MITGTSTRLSTGRAVAPAMAAILFAAGGGSAASHARPQESGVAPQASAPEAPPREWVDRLGRDDRAALETLLGFAAPSWEGIDGVELVGRGPESLQASRGRPDVVQ